jgi:hypothetical protein
VEYKVQMTLGGTMYISSMVAISSGIQLILSLKPKQIVRLQFWQIYELMENAAYIRLGA